MGSSTALGIIVLHVLLAFRYRAIFLLLFAVHLLLAAARIAHPDIGRTTYAGLAGFSYCFSMAMIAFLCFRLGGFFGRPLKEPDVELW